MPASSRYAADGRLRARSPGGPGLAGHGIRAAGAWTTGVEGVHRAWGSGPGGPRRRPRGGGRWSLPAELLRRGRRRAARGRRAARVDEQGLDGVASTSPMSWPVDEQAGVADDGRQAADVGGDDRGPARLRPRARPARTTRCARARGRGRRRGTTARAPAGRPAGTNRTDAVDAELRRRAPRAGRSGRGRSRWGRRGRRASDRVVAPVGVPAEQLGADAEQHVGRLERLDAADEEQHPRGSRAGRGSAGPRPGRRA